MRVDIVHMRDPDSACDHIVYVDGVQVDAEFWEFDPGAGYDHDDIDEMLDEKVAAAPEFLKPTIRRICDDMRECYEHWGL